MQYMIAALNTAQTVALIVVPILLIQWALSFFCLMRLYKNKPIHLKTGVWNVVVLFGVIIGPVLYLLTEKPNARYPKESGSTANDEVAQKGDAGTMGAQAGSFRVGDAAELNAETLPKQDENQSKHVVTEKSLQEEKESPRENGENGGDYMI